MMTETFCPVDSRFTPVGVASLIATVLAQTIALEDTFKCLGMFILASMLGLVIFILHVDRYRSKVFISTIPTPGVTLWLRSRTSNFHKKVRVKVFALKFIRPHILKTL